MNELDVLLKMREILSRTTPTSRLIINGDSLFVGNNGTSLIVEAHTIIQVVKVRGMRVFKIFIKDYQDTNRENKCIVVGEDNNDGIIFLKAGNVDN